MESTDLTPLSLPETDGDWSGWFAGRSRDTLTDVGAHVAALKDAPNYDAAEIRDLGGPEYRTYGDTIYGYYGTYGAVPYW